MPRTLLCSEPVLTTAAYTLSLIHCGKGQNMVPLRAQENSSPPLPLYSNWVSIKKTHLWIPRLPGKHCRLFRQYPTGTVHGDCSPVQSIDSRTSPSPLRRVASLSR